MIAHLVMSNNFSSFWPFIWPSYYGPGGRRGWRPPILSLSLSCWLFKNNLLELKYSGPSLLRSSPFAPTVHRRSFLKYLSCRSFAIAQTKTPTQMTVNSLYNNVHCTVLIMPLKTKGSDLVLQSGSFLFENRCQPYNNTAPAKQFSVPDRSSLSSVYIHQMKMKASTEETLGLTTSD